jgi:glycosyltransferase involved in cell wall biosynthesis
MERPRLAILIPAYCEEGTIGAVVSRAKMFGDVIVADDNSTDNTSQVAKMAGAIVLKNDNNLGYEGNLNRLFEYAGRNGYQYAVTLDADGEHKPEILETFRKLLIEEGVPLVLGYRPRTQRFAEMVMGFIMRLRFGIRDILCGMKGYDMALLKHAGGVFDRSGSIGTELALTSIRRGTKYAQVAVSGTPRIERPRFDRTFQANVRIFRALFRALGADISLQIADNDAKLNLPTDRKAS